MKNNWFCPNCGQPMEAQRHVDNSTRPNHMDNRLPQPETLPHTRLHERRHRRNPTRETPTPVKYISLFSGIEAATVAWQPLGWEPIAYAEVEPFPKAVLKQHYPNVPDLGDMTKVDWKQYHHAADVVVGGSPCQAFSIAGLRKALDDPRGQLMLEYLRACAEIDPEWIVWENVPGVLSAEHGRAFQSLLEAVAELWPDGGGGGMESAGRSVLRCGPATRACVPCRQH